jgi:hypothetical protein
VTDLAPISGKLAKLIRLLGSNTPGEVTATVEALNRTLQGIGADVHDIADRIETSGNGALAEKEMQQIYDAGIRKAPGGSNRSYAVRRAIARLVMARLNRNSHPRQTWRCSATSAIG